MGKSTMAQKLLQEKGFPYVSTDGLTVMLKPLGQPSFYSPEKSEQFFPYLDLFISRIRDVGPDYVIEGDAFSPQQVAKLKQKYEIKSIFLTMTNIEKGKIVKYAKHDKWVEKVSDEHLDNLVNRISNASQIIQEQCKKSGIDCFDLSENYESVFIDAYTCLIVE